MRSQYDIGLNRMEWEAFERKLNTVDRDREQRADSFLHRVDGIVTATRDGDRTGIDIPWIEDQVLLSMLRKVQDQQDRVVSRTATISISTVSDDSFGENVANYIGGNICDPGKKGWADSYPNHISLIEKSRTISGIPNANYRSDQMGDTLCAA